MTRPPLILTALAGVATSAAAQPPSFTSASATPFARSGSEGNGNNTGILEPGGSAAIRMDVSFTNPSGAAAFAPPIGTFAAGTVLGFGAGFLDIDGDGGTQGAFNNGLPTTTNNGSTGYGVRSGWRRAGWGNGSLNSAGTGLLEIQFGQFPAEPSLASTANPIPRMFAFLWTPASYASRTITFSVSPAVPGGPAASVYLALDQMIGASIYTSQTQLGSVSIPIVPAPASLLALAIAAPRRP